MTVTTSDGYLLLDPDHAADLLELLARLDEVLRYGGDDLRADIRDRYHPSTLHHLLESLDCQTILLHRALNHTTGRNPTTP